MMHRIILKGADDCVFTMLSIIYDDIVNKIEKAKYTMEEGLGTKDRDEAVQELDKLLNTKVKEEDGKLIVANDGSPLRNYIGKNKPLLNTLLFRREYTDRPQDKAFGPQKEASKLPPVDIQKLQFLIDNKINSLQDFKDKLKEMDYDSKFKSMQKVSVTVGDKAVTKEIPAIKPEFVTTQKIKVPAVSEEMEKKNKQIASAAKRIQALLQTELVNSQKQVEEFNKNKSLSNYQNLSDTAKGKVLSDEKIKFLRITQKLDKKYDEEKKRIRKLRENKNLSEEERKQVINLFRAVNLYSRFARDSRTDLFDSLSAQLKGEKKLLESKVKQQKDKLDKLKKDLDELSKDKDGNVLMEEMDVEVYSPEFYEQTKKFAQDTKLFEMFLDKEGKPIKGLSKIIKDAPKRIKEMKSAQKDIDSKATDSLSLFLNSPALKGKGSPVVRRGRETNYDILIYDLRKVLVLLLNAFGPEYKRQVNTMMEKIKDSLSNEMERLKDIKISDETARAIQQEGKLTDEMNSFYTQLSKVLRELRSEKTVADFFRQKPFSKQRLIRMIMEDKDYLKYRIPKAKESDKLILLKDEMAEPSQIGDIKERLNKKNISKIITILIKNKISPSELFTVKDKATVKSKFKKYTDDFSDIVENIETKFMSVNDVLDEEVEKLKKIFTIQEGARGKLISFGSDSDIPDISEYKTEINAIEGSLNSIKLEQLETLAQKLREKIKDHEGEKASENATDFFTTSEKNLDELKKVKVNLEKLVKEQEKMYNDFFEQWSKLVVEQKDKEEKDRLKSDLNIQRQLIVETKTKLYNASEKISGIERTLKALKQKSMFKRFESIIVGRVARSDNREFNRLNRAMKRIKRIMRAKEAPKGAEAKRNLRRGK